MSRSGQRRLNFDVPPGRSQIVHGHRILNLKRSMGSTGSNPQIVIDWAEVEDLDALYDSLFAQTGAPSWHGRNLNALNDSWVTGSICSEGPPFDFVLRNEDHAKPGLEEAAKAIRENRRGVCAGEHQFCKTLANGHNTPALTNPLPFRIQGWRVIRAPRSEPKTPPATGRRVLTNRSQFTSRAFSNWRRAQPLACS